MYIKWCRRLGVELSLAKTHVSIDTYEFAKRWFKSGFEFTGLPLRGIIDNLVNPQIVFTILFDYFKIKNNLYLYKGNLLMLLKEFYKDTPLFVLSTRGWRLRRLSISGKLLKGLSLFAASLDDVFGYLTEEGLRKAFLDNVTNPSYQIPSSYVGLLCEFNRVIGDGLAVQIGKGIDKVVSIRDDVIKFNTFGCDPNYLRHYPLFIAIVNSVTRFHQLQKK